MFEAPGGAVGDAVVQITLRVNGDVDGATGAGKHFSLSPASTDFQQFLRDASKAADMYPDAQAAFNEYGDEILNCLLIEDNDVIFLVKPGETFIKPKGADGALLPKQVGKFAVGQPLGLDRMGMHVTLGEDPHTQERVVLKFMSRRSIRSVEQSDKIQNEVDCLLKLSHPNILKLLSVRPPPASLAPFHPDPRPLARRHNPHP